MAKPVQAQRLDIDKCETTSPPNATKLLTGVWYCDEGWMANTAGEASEYYSGIAQDTARTICIKVIVEEPTPIRDPKPPIATGVGAKRYFFEAGAIDRTYTDANYYNNYIIRSSWENHPYVEDKFRAANGLFWTWSDDESGIEYLRSPKAHTPDPDRLQQGVLGYGTGIDASATGTSVATADNQLGPFRVSIKDKGYGGSPAITGTANISLYAEYENLSGGEANENSFWFPYLDPNESGGYDRTARLKNKFNSLVETIIKKSTEQEEVWFHDHTFELTGPMRKDLASPSDLTGGIKYYRVEPVYNYYVPKYEALLNDTTDKEIKEPLLPNLYVLLDTGIYSGVAGGSDGIQRGNYKKHIFHGTATALDPGPTSNPLTPKSGAKLHQRLTRDYSWWDATAHAGKTSIYGNNPEATQKSKYFTEFANQHYKNNPPLSDLEKKFTNILIAHGTTSGGSTGTVESLQSHNTKKKAFPMYVEIEFSTPSSYSVDHPGSSLGERSEQVANSFTEKLRNTRMSCHLMKMILAEEKKESTIIQEKEYIEFLEKRESPGANEFPLTDDTGPISKKRREIDITDWFDDDDSNDFASLTIPDTLLDINNDFIFLGESCRTGAAINLTTSMATFEPALLAAAIAHRPGIAGLHFKNIMEGQKAEKEIVFYRIEKLDSVGNTIQNFYLPNSNDIHVHNFVDTQVKYGKQYTYKVHAWMLVYGLKYKYTGIDKVYEPLGPTPLAANKPEANISVEYKQSIKLIEVPYFEHTTTVLDTPPVHPNVEVIPYSGVNNRLMINLNSGAGDIIRAPRTIEASESQDLYNFYLSQNIYTNQGSLRYKIDDFADKYRIYRLDDKPSTYSDFARGIIRDIDTPGSVSVSLDEKVIPNKKYWYTFRAIDVHNHLSYPTDVYQIELVDDGSSIYPLVDTLDLDLELERKAENLKTPTKNLKRLLQIIPSANHIYLKNDAEKKFLDAGGVKSLYDTDSDFALGTAASPLWGKKFKIRLTSKKTGKKVDINVEFNNDHLPNKP